MKINLLLFICLSIVASSCAPVFLVDKPSLSKIPKGSTKVIAHNAATPDEVFSIIAKNMAKSGCPVKSEKEAMQIVCDGKSVEGGTLLRAMAFVEQAGDSSKVTFSGEWGLDASGQMMMSAFAGRGGISGGTKIVWEGVAGTKPCVAFQHLILMAKEIPDSQITYNK